MQAAAWAWEKVRIGDFGTPYLHAETVHGPHAGHGNWPLPAAVQNTADH
jgi:hypothetical protein